MCVFSPYVRCLLFNDSPLTYIYTLSLHDALPIYHLVARDRAELLARDFDRQIELAREARVDDLRRRASAAGEDRKSTRLNSSHLGISYAVFCLKKKKTQTKTQHITNNTHQLHNRT